MPHERSETIRRPDGKWINVYGRGLPKAGQPLPRQHDFERDAYDTVEEAEAAARRRSEETDPKTLKPRQGARGVEEIAADLRNRARARERIGEIDQFIAETAAKYGVRPEIIRRIIKQESGGDPHAIGKDGEIGLMQLMPDTARRYGVENPHNPRANIEGGVHFFSDLLREKKGNEAAALTAYNGSTAYLKHFRDLLTGPAMAGARAAGPVADVLREPSAGTKLAEATPPPPAAARRAAPPQPETELPPPPSVGQRLAGAFRDLLPALPAIGLGIAGLRGRGGPRRPPELPPRELPGLPEVVPKVPRTTEPEVPPEPEWSRRAKQPELPGATRPEIPPTPVRRPGQKPVEDLPLFARVREELQQRVASMQARLFGPEARPVEPGGMPAVRDFRETAGRVEPRLAEMERRAVERPAEGVKPPGPVFKELPPEAEPGPEGKGARHGIVRKPGESRLVYRPVEAVSAPVLEGARGPAPAPQAPARPPEPVASRIEEAVTRFRHEGDRGIAWTSMHMRPEEHRALSQFLVEQGHPLAMQPGTDESRFRAFVRERAAEPPPQRPPEPLKPPSAAPAPAPAIAAPAPERAGAGKPPTPPAPPAPSRGPVAAIAPPIPLPGPSEDEKRPWARGLERVAQVAGMALPLLGLATLRGKGIRPPSIAGPGGAEAFRPPEVLPQFRRESIRSPETPVGGEAGGVRRGAGGPSVPGTLGPHPKPGVASRPDIPREGTLDPPLAGGGGQGGGPRRPGSALFDPDVPPNRPLQQGYFDRLKRLLQRQRERLPAELRTITRVPDSPVISILERHHVGLERDLEGVLNAPFHKATHAHDAEGWKEFEHQAVTAWMEGGQTPESYARAVGALPAEFQQQIHFRQERFLRDQAARASLGLDPIPEQPGPYFARVTDAEYRDVVNVLGTNRGLAGDLQQTVKSFQRERTQTTMLAGQADGIMYEDPRLAWLLREWNSIKLRRTAQLMRDLTGTVLFKERGEAAAAARAYPGAEAVRIEGLPGTQETWWVRSREERNLVAQNLVHSAPSLDLFGLGNAVHVMNQLFRNPNLYNPLPHFLKNMLYKYGLSGGRPRAFADMAEYWKGTDPELRTEFARVMPFTRTGRTAQDLLRQAIGRNPLEKVAQLVGRVNRLSSRAIFAELDPALRYARYKQYRDAGLGPQAAANHVWVDLIRYGTRSEIVDQMKAIPGNFFVPWRVGTVTSLVKQVRSHPIRAALFVAGVDLIRESYYRQTGRWVHIPVDYVEGPLSQAVDDPKTIPFIAATTALFGPGGAYGATILIDMLNTVRGTEDWKRLANLFWGFSQVLEVPKEMAAMVQDGDPKHLANLVTGLALGTHTALSYRPRRLGEYLPEWIPGLQKTEIVRAAEAMQDVKKAKREASAVHKAAREAAQPTGQTEEERQIGQLARSAGITPRRIRPETPEEKEARRRYRETVQRLQPALRARVLRELQGAGRE